MMHRPTICALALVCGVHIGCGHRWYPGATIVDLAQISSDAHEARAAEQRREQAEAKAAEDAAQKAAAARHRAVIASEGATVDPARTEFAAGHIQRIASHRLVLRRSPGDVPTAHAFARAVVALATIPESQRSGLDLAGLADESAGHLQAALASTSTRTADASWRADTLRSFCLLGDLPRTPAVDGAFAGGCTLARPAIADDQVASFTADCHARASGDAPTNRPHCDAAR